MGKMSHELYYKTSGNCPGLLLPSALSSLSVSLFELQFGKYSSLDDMSQGTNMVERLNKEIKRRAQVATLFPNEASLWNDLFDNDQRQL